MNNNRFKEYSFVCILMITTVVLRVYHIEIFISPWVMADEAGYWTHAANMAGMSWKNLVTGWYSYGYSLLLVPIFWFTQDLSVMYKIAIIENALLSVLGLFIGYKIIDLLTKNSYLSKRKKLIISFLAINYSAYIFQSQIAWSETFCYVFFLIVLYSIILFLNKTSYVNGIFSTLMCMFLYIIHNRNLSVVIAYAILITYLLLKKRITIKHFVSYIMIICLIYICNSHIKELFALQEWGRVNGYSGNDVSVGLTKMLEYASIRGIISFVKSLIGKIWYLLVSTCGLIIYAFCGIYSNLKDDILDKNIGKKGEFYLFIVLCIVGVLFIEAITMNDITKDGRIDPIFYGRYADMLSWIFVSFGLLELFDGKVSKLKIIFASIIIYMICIFEIRSRIGNEVQVSINIPCVPGIYFTHMFNYELFTLISFLVFFIITILCIFLKNYINIEWIVVSIFLLVTFNNVAINGYNLTIKIWQMGIAKNESVYNFFDSTYGSEPLYIDFESYAKYCLFRLNVANTVKENLITEKPVGVNGSNYIVVTDKDDYICKEGYKYVYLEDNESDIAIYVHGDKLISKLEEDNFVLFDNTVLLKEDDINLSLEKENILIKKGEKLDISLEFEGEDDILYVNTDDYRISYHIYDMSNNLIEFNGLRTIEGYFFDGKKIALEFDENLSILQEEGEYRIDIDVVQEGVKWISDDGYEIGDIFITVAQ